MSDNPMYWAGHQRPAWHQQQPPPPSAQASMVGHHYGTHPGQLLSSTNHMPSSNQVAGMPGDPTLQMQSSIPGRHQPNVVAPTSLHAPLPPGPNQSSLYSTSMLQAPNSATPGSIRSSSSQLTNSHLTSQQQTRSQGLQPHQASNLQQPTHQQSHYSNQYSSLSAASSYWSQPPNLGSVPTASAQPGPGSGNSTQPQQQTDSSASSSGTGGYLPANSSTLPMPNDAGRSGITTNSSNSMPQTNPSPFLSPKDIQSSSDHIGLTSYDRQRASSMSQAQQPHPSAMMSQNIPSSTASNLSPGQQTQMSMQNRLQSQTQLDSMRSMSQQPSWSGSYHAQPPSQSPYSSVMNSYMGPYGSSSAVPNHASNMGQAVPRAAITQKHSAISDNRTSATSVYPPHGSSIYGQQAPTASGANGGYYGYDSYYNQVSSQTAPDSYLTQANTANPSHWPSIATSTNQMISNSSSGPVQTQLRQPSGPPSGPTMHPQSPPASASLPPISSRPLPPSSQTPNRSPVPQHAPSYTSPNQPNYSNKTTSNSLAQLEQMVMPGSGPSTTPAIESPTHRSSTSSPSTNQQQQQQLQYSYNSSGQGSYFNTSSNTASQLAPQSSNYYPQYDSTIHESQKTSWSDPNSASMINPAGPSGPILMRGGPSSYQSQANYDGTGYGDYTTLSAPNSSMSSQPRFTTPSDVPELQHPDKAVDPYAIDSQTFDDFEDQSTSTKSKRSRAKRGEEKAKRERKPRAPRAPKISAPVAQPLSPNSTANSSLTQGAKMTPPQQSILSQTPTMSPSLSRPNSNSYPSPNQGQQLQNQQQTVAATNQDTQIQSLIEPQVPSWIEQSSNSVTNLSGPISSMPQPQSATSMLVNSDQSAYISQQSSYDESNYSEFKNLSGPPDDSSVQQNFSAQTSENSDPQQPTDKNLSESILSEPQTVDKPDDQTPGPKSRSRTSKKGEEKVKKESKPRPSRAAKAASSVQQSQSPALASSPHFDQASIGVPSVSETSPSQRQQTVEPDLMELPPSHQKSDTMPDTLMSSSDITETVHPEAAELATDEKPAESTPSTKTKKSRPKKSSDGKPKRNRKSRAKVTPPDLPEQSQEKIEQLLPTSPPSESVGEASVSQPASESTPAEQKPKRLRIRDSSSKGKKKLPKFALKFAKTKKRKRLGSSDNEQSEIEKTPPPSPDELESGVQKRRSARNTKKLKYNEDIELGFSESDDDSQILPRSKKASSTTASAEKDGAVPDEPATVDEPTVFAAPVEDTMVVEKIMATRKGTRELEPEPGEVLPPDQTHIEVEEFYVKYKNLSYLHCDWRTLEELEKGDRRIAQKIKRYKQKKDSSNMFSFMEDEPFDPQYCEVDRILAVNEVEELVPDSDDDEGNQQAPKSFDKSKSENNLVKSETENKEGDVASSSEQEKKTEVAMTVDGTDAEVNEIDEKNDELKSNEIDNKGEVDQDKSVVDEEKKESQASDESKNDQTSEVKSVINEQETSTENTENSKSVLPVTNGQDSVSSQENTKIEEKSQKMKKKISRHFLVKWRGLSYEDSTWELGDDLDPEKIKHFEKFKNPPPKSKWKPVKRPKPDDWKRKEASPVYKNNNTLREYQLEGLNWLSFCWHQGRNCILADEMGLGKTIQSIAFVNEIYEHGINGPFLIIVPLSTVGNWAREFETWTDLNVITYHGSSTSREMLKEYEMFYRNDQGNRITQYYKFQVMITTFEIILSDCLDLREIPWRCCIIDEAHRLKNRNCKLLEGLRLLNMEHRVLLTGTPLQNNVEELFSLLNFLEPIQFSSTEQFLQEFGDLKTEAQVDKLKMLLKPMMLRRLKEDVEKSLAPKEETIVEVELTNIQKKYYRAIVERNFSFLSKGTSSNNMPNLMNTMMELRKCCIHPYLINGAEEQILYEARQAKLAGGEPMSAHQAMVNSSGKLVLIDKLLPRLRADGHRVLIFSQMVRCLDILEDYLAHKHYPFERIDGRVRGGDRQQAIDRFSKAGSDRFVFLLCTRAGGLGINLTAADTVIIFDSDWNPQNDLQAQARCHRIGQSKAVKIYRLICRKTYEREMFDKASLKLGLDKAVLQSMNTQKGGLSGGDGQLTKKDIEELLKKGAYGALMEDDDSDKFCEEDIDQILQRRTTVITIDNTEAKGSTFSKATFSSSNNREDIDLDDPNFWEKWAKKANIDCDDMLTKGELIQLAPRRRTQTKRYGADGSLLDMSDLESSEEDEETISMRTRGSRRANQPKLTPSSGSKRNKRNRMFELDDDDNIGSHDGGYWSKGDCLKVEKGLLTYGWGRWDKIISCSTFKREIQKEECESICRVILLYCLNSYKGDEKIKSFAWELITPADEISKDQQDQDENSSTRSRKSKPSPNAKKTVADEISDSQWPKEPKNDPLIALPDDQYRRHLQRNCNRLLIRVKFLHYLKEEILKGYQEKILSECSANEIDLPAVPVDGELPAPWWDDEADKSLLIGIFKHGHDKFNLMRQDPNLCFLLKCGPPNRDDLMAEMNCVDRSADDIDDDNKDAVPTKRSLKYPKSSDCEVDDVVESLLDSVVNDSSEVSQKTGLNTVLDENKNSILKSVDQTSVALENGVSDSSQTVRMDATDDESLTNDASVVATIPDTTENIVDDNISDEFLPFPSPNDLNQRFRRLITAYQRNFKKLEIKLAQKARDELKKERYSKFEAAKNEREERKRTLAQKWSRREEADFFRAISSYGVEYDSSQKRHDWNKFRSIGKLEKKLDETMDEYYKAFVAMCKRVTSRPLTKEEENCPINVDAITEDRAIRCLSRIEFLNKIREIVINHPELDERLKLCHSQSDLPDWWINGLHDKDLLLAATKYGLTRLDYNLAHDPELSFHTFIREKAEQLFLQPPTPLVIPLEQLQELLELNGIEYMKDVDLQDDEADVKLIIDSILDNLEYAERSASEQEVAGDGSFKNLDESLLSASETMTLKGTIKSTRCSSGIMNIGSRSLTSSVGKRGANTIVKSIESNGSSNHSIRLSSSGPSTRHDGGRLVEITPLVPDKMPDEFVKNLEAGELSVTIQSQSALLQLDQIDKQPPIVLLGAVNPITVKIRWPKDKAIQTRLENLVHLIEKNEWPNAPKPPVPTITLPNHLAPSTSSLPSQLFTSSPSKNDKFDAQPSSPKSDVSNISSRASKQDLKETSNDATPSRTRRAKGRRGRQPEPDKVVAHDVESPKEDRQAAAKLRNLLSQGSSSSKASVPSSSDKPSGKPSANKQAAGLSSLLASFKQKGRAGNNLGPLGIDDKSLPDLSSPSLASFLPQILANMKPEFREVFASQDASSMLLNTLSGVTGSGGAGANLRSAGSSAQLALESLLNLPRSSSKSGPPPAHQRTDNLPSAHGSPSTRELRRSSQHNRDDSPPMIGLRSGRGKQSVASQEPLAHQKSSEASHGKLPSGKKRARLASTSSSSPPTAPNTDILDLSSLPGGTKENSSSKTELRNKKHRDQKEDLSTSVSTRSSTSLPSKASLKATPKNSSSRESEQPADKSTRTTRSSKRIGSRIDALALNLQAKRLNRGESPGAELSPSLPKESKQSAQPVAAHGSGKLSHESRAQSSKAPPAAHSGSHKSSSSTAGQLEQREKINPTPTIPPVTSQPATTPSRQDPLTQLMANPSSLLAGLNPSIVGGAGDLMNQLLRKAGSNDLLKNLLNEFVKNPSLALDPNILATLTASLPLNSQSLPGFNLPTSQPPTSIPSTSSIPSSSSIPSTSSKTTPSSLLNDFKVQQGSSLMKRSRHESNMTTATSPQIPTATTSASRSANSNSSSNLSNNESRRSSATSDRHDRRALSSSDRKFSSSFSDKQSKNDKRTNASQQEVLVDSSSRRSSSSLLAQHAPISQSSSQIPSAAALAGSQSSLLNAGGLNLASQFGGLNSLSGLLNFPGMNELMKQMGNFPGLANSLPRVPTTSLAPPTLTPATSASAPVSQDKASRRSRQSATSSASLTTPTSSVSSQQAANAALANSLMNLASQPTAAPPNPYGNYANPLANPFLSFGLANLGMNSMGNLGNLSNPLGMGLFPNLYMPSGFPTPDQQQQPQQPSNQTSGSADGNSKDKRLRYPRK